MVFQMVARTAISLCHAPALALVGWALISPPMINTDVGGQVDIGAPVSEWNIVGEGFATVRDCEQFRVQEGQDRVRVCLNATCTTMRDLPIPSPIAQRRAASGCTPDDDPRLAK
jgi:hypothetical protein